jgi:hypothetical protein
MIRRLHRTDTAQPAIVEELRQLGIVVVILGRPVDLLCRHVAWPTNVWKLVEIKTPTKGGGFKKRLDQQAQGEFCAHHGIPRLTTTEAILAYLQGQNDKSPNPGEQG